MTTIGSTNPYSASSLLATLGRNGNDKGANSGGSEYSASKQTQSGTASITGSETVFGSKLAGALWTMESEGVEIDQSANDTWLGEQPSSSVADEFMELSKKTFAERIRDQYLDEHGLTEDDLKAMSPEDRAVVEADIRKSILEAMGVNGDNQDAAMNMGAGNGQSANQSAGQFTNALGAQNAEDAADTLS